MTSENIHQRNQQRFIINQEFLVKTASGNNQRVTIRNISLGGACMDWNEPCQPGDRLNICFSTDLVLESEIRWFQKNNDCNEIGVHFFDVDEVASIYLGEYIQTLLKRVP
ncbi:MAG: PilZ domain-containing protein [SAR324 cluster bacterium]|nr:PilZ domain-containing protein [SAR324 cluster bacterium]